jgi:hypothetical protein
MLSEGKFIPLLASYLRADHPDQDPGDRQAGFTDADLPYRPDQVDSKQASRIVQTLLTMLLANPGLRSAAVDMLNQHLEAAVRNAYQLGSGRLYRAMLQVREEFARQNLEIILRVEDFALIQGVQRELLDAITEPAVRGESGRYAPIRTLMAVTTGYFTDLPETVMSRVAAATTGYVYDLDVPFNRQDDGAEEIASFAGRYLNAARIGKDELDLLGPGNVKNFCDGCDYKVPCHDAFGSSAEGYGLYPFNQPALLRAIHSVNSVAAGADQWAFVPRSVLGRVLRPVLIEHAAALADGLFPDGSLSQRFRPAPIDPALPNSVAQAVAEYDQAAPEQRRQILEFWGDAPDDPNDISPAILRAFGLSPLPKEASGTLITGGKKREGPRPGTADGDGERRVRVGALARKIQNIEEWGARDHVELDAPVAREIRGILVGAAIRRYPFRSPLMREQTRAVLGGAWPSNSSVVSIAAAGGQRLANTDAAPMQFLRGPGNALFFQSLLRASDDMEEARPEDIRRLASLAETHTGSLTAALQGYLNITDVNLTVGLRASLLGAALAGRAWPAQTEADLLCAALDYGQGWRRGDAALLTPRWQQALESHMRARVALVDRLRDSVGVAQGRGAVSMIDAVRIRPLLRQASDWVWNAESSPPDWVKPAVLGFAQWAALVEGQFSALATKQAHIRQLFPSGESGSETADDVRRALEGSVSAGIGAAREDSRRLRDSLSRLEQVDWRVIAEIDHDLGKTRADGSPHDGRWAATVTAAARDRGESPGIIGEFLEASDRWLDGALPSAAARREPDGDDAAKQVAALLAEWSALAKPEGGDQ